MARHKKTWMGGGLLAVLGLSALSPVQQAGVGLAAAGAMMWSAPVLAQNNVPGVGTVVKSDCAYRPKPCKRHIIIAPSDANGEVRLTGLTPGDYAVQVFGGREETPMKVAADGELAFVAHEDIKRADPKATAPRARRALPVVRRWAEPIPFRDAAAPPPPPEAAAGPSCPTGAICAWSKVDLNTASAQEIADLTGTSMQSAVHIMVQREKGGRYASIEDFARRNCRTMAIDMSRGGIQIGDVVVLFSSSQAKGAATGSQLPGFQCGPRDGKQFSLYGKKHNYVGHVTLLR